MAAERIFVAGSFRDASDCVGTFQAADPASGTPLPESYPISGRADVALACAAGVDAAAALQGTSVERIAAFLERYAAEIEARAAELVTRAARETGLPEKPRLLEVELPRTTSQLRAGAAAARERSWCQATIDTKANIRSKYGVLGGPVVVFGPNNFPFAFNAVAGGDFVAAVAAGNPVIAKANPGHPGTSRLLVECAVRALERSGLPLATLQLLYALPPELGLELVSHPAVGASAFTGTRAAGLRLKEAADRAGKPIYLEMSSSNPIFVLPGALAERSAAIANELHASCLLGAGQFCTRPGLTFAVAGRHTDAFFEVAKALFVQRRTGTLLGAAAPGAIEAAIAILVANGAELVAGGKPASGPGYSFESTLLRATGAAFLARPKELSTEAFGPVNMLVVTKDESELVAVAAALEGNLTASIYSHTGNQDDFLHARLEPVLRRKVGRLLNDKMPTGVAVTPAMNHGGPFPATGHPGFTAVGIPASLVRFAALHCYDGVRSERLPSDLADENPTGTMWRRIDGEWSQKDVQR